MILCQDYIASFHSRHSHSSTRVGKYHHLGLFIFLFYFLPYIGLLYEQVKDHIRS